MKKQKFKNDKQVEINKKEQEIESVTMQKSRSGSKRVENRGQGVLGEVKMEAEEEKSWDQRFKDLNKALANPSSLARFQ